MKILLIGLIFFSCYLNIYLLFSFVLNRPKTIDRVHIYTQSNHMKKVSVSKKQKGISVLQFSKIISLFGKAVIKLNFMSKLKDNHQKELIKAAIPLKGEEFIVIQIMLSFLCAFIAFQIFDTLIAGFFFGILGIAVPEIVVKHKKNKRLKQFNDQLGDTVVMISNSLKVGHSFLQAIDTASKEMPEPISKELGKLVHEMKLGVSSEAAFDNLLKRVESDDLSLMITAVNIQRQTGGNLAEILDIISKTIRERIKMKGEIKTLTAQGKLSGIIVSALPILIAIPLTLMDPEYLKPLYTTKLGIVLLCIAVFNEIVGYLIINKIVKIDF